MNALTILLLVVTVIYLTIYQRGFWAYYFGILIPYYIITQIILCDFKTNTPKKKFFISSWTHPFDSQIYASDKIDIVNLKVFLEKYNKEHNCKIGITIFIMKLLGNLFKKYPKLNGNVLFGLFLKKPQIDISCMITTDNGRDSQTITIKDTDKLSLEELSSKVQEKKDLIERHLDLNVNRQKFCCSFIPTFMLAPFLRIMSYLSCCGANLSWLGLPKYRYGTAIVANYGKIGMSDTYLPICPFSYAPFVIGMSTSKKYEHFDKDNKKTTAEKIKFMFTIDHRYIDGAIAGKLITDIENIITKPELLFDDKYFEPKSKKEHTETIKEKKE